MANSLIAVLFEHFADHARRRQREFDNPHNRGAGSIDETYATDARGGLARVEEIIRQLSGGPPIVR